MSSVLLVFLILMGACILLVPVLIGVFVYKDAKSRHMDAALWTVIAVLIPGLIGLMIYLVIRNNNTNQSCPGCRGPVVSGHALCPRCGMRLKASCPSCAAAVDDGWKLCPQCGCALPAQCEPSVTQAVPQKDRKLAWILIVAITIPLIVLTVGILGMLNWASDTSTFGGGPLVRREDGAIFPDIVSWMDRCDTQGQGVFVLELSPDKARQVHDFVSIHPGEKLSGDVYFICVYINQRNGQTLGIAGAEVFHGSNTMVLTYEDVDPDKDFPGNALSYQFVSGRDCQIETLTILINGEEVEYSLSELE